MKRRFLRPSIQLIIETLSIFILVFLACVNDFSLKSIPFLILISFILILNGIILKKYGKDYWHFEMKIV